MAIASGASNFTIPAGDFAFDSASLLISGASSLTISGNNNSHLWFNPGYGVDVQGCADGSVGGFTIDTLSPAFSQGQLLALDLKNKTARLRVETGFPLPDTAASFNQTCPDGSPGYCGEIKAVFWDPRTRRMLQVLRSHTQRYDLFCRPTFTHLDSFITTSA